jgi:hypothetical protein
MNRDEAAGLRDEKKRLTAPKIMQPVATVATMMEIFCGEEREMPRSMSALCPHSDTTVARATSSQDTHQVTAHHHRGNGCRCKENHNAKRKHRPVTVSAGLRGNGALGLMQI